MPLNQPYIGHPLMIIDPVYQYDFSESINSSVQVNNFQSGVSVRNRLSSRKRRTFKLLFRTVKTGLMNDLERFYRDLDGPLQPFWFKPPLERFAGRYTKLVSDGSQKLEDFESTLLRVGDQSILVRFTQPFNRTLFKPLLENTGLILEEVFGEDDPGKYIQFDGLLENQNATIPDHAQDFLDLNSKDFMIDFLFRGETIFTSSSASYAAMSGKTLIFTIEGTPYTVTFTAAVVDAATTAQEINDQHGDKVECQVFGTDELKISTLIDSGYFTISGTAFAQLNLAAPVVFPIHKHDGVDTGYYIKQDGTGDLTFFMESGGTAATVTAASAFHLFDGAWHYIVIVIDESGNGQFYVDGSANGSPVSVSAVGSIDNDADFSINKDANANLQMNRVGIWSWDSGNLPAGIATTISNLLDSWNERHSIDVADEDGLQVLYTFDDETGDDFVQQEDLDLNNNPAFFDFDQ